MLCANQTSVQILLNWVVSRFLESVNCHLYFSDWFQLLCYYFISACVVSKRVQHNVVMTRTELENARATWTCRGVFFNADTETTLQKFPELGTMLIMNYKLGTTTIDVVVSIFASLHACADSVPGAEWAWHRLHEAVHQRHHVHPRPHVLRRRRQEQTQEAQENHRGVGVAQVRFCCRLALGSVRPAGCGSCGRRVQDIACLFPYVPLRGKLWKITISFDIIFRIQGLWLFEQSWSFKLILFKRTSKDKKETPHDKSRMCSDWNLEVDKNSHCKTWRCTNW